MGGAEVATAHHCIYGKPIFTIGPSFLEFWHKVLIASRLDGNPSTARDNKRKISDGYDSNNATGLG